MNNVKPKPLPLDMPVHEYVRSSGALLELNRLVLHPIGLALAVLSDGSAKILDYREDPEGFCFSESPDVFDLFHQYGVEAEKRTEARRALFPCVDSFGRKGVQSLGSCVGQVNGSIPALMMNKKTADDELPPDDDTEIPVNCCWCMECDHCCDGSESEEDRLSGPWPPKE